MKSEPAIRQMLGMLRAFNSTESAIKALAWVLDECPPRIPTADSARALAGDGLADGVSNRRGVTEVEKSTSSSQEKNNG